MPEISGEETALVDAASGYAIGEPEGQSPDGGQHNQGPNRGTDHGETPSTWMVSGLGRNGVRQGVTCGWLAGGHSGEIIPVAATNEGWDQTGGGRTRALRLTREF